MKNIIYVFLLLLPITLFGQFCETQCIPGACGGIIADETGETVFCEGFNDVTFPDDLQSSSWDYYNQGSPDNTLSFDGVLKICDFRNQGLGIGGASARLYNDTYFYNHRISTSFRLDADLPGAVVIIAGDDGLEYPIRITGPGEIVYDGDFRTFPIDPESLVVNLSIEITPVNDYTIERTISIGVNDIQTHVNLPFNSYNISDIYFEATEGTFFIDEVCQNITRPLCTSINGALNCDNFFPPSPQQLDSDLEACYERFGSFQLLIYDATCTRGEDIENYTWIIDGRIVASGATLKEYIYDQCNGTNIYSLDPAVELVVTDAEGRTSSYKMGSYEFYDPSGVSSSYRAPLLPSDENVLCQQFENFNYDISLIPDPRAAISDIDIDICNVSSGNIITTNDGPQQFSWNCTFPDFGCYLVCFEFNSNATIGVSSKLPCLPTFCKTICIPEERTFRCDEVNDLICNITNSESETLIDNNDPSLNQFNDLYATDIGLITESFAHMNNHRDCENTFDGCDDSNDLSEEVLFNHYEVAYRFRPDATVRGKSITIDLESIIFPGWGIADHDVFIYRQCNDSGVFSDCVASSSRPISSSGNQESVTIDNVSGSYYIVVDVQSGTSTPSSGYYRLSLTCGDLCDINPVKEQCRYIGYEPSSLSENHASYYCGCTEVNGSRQGIPYGLDWGPEQVYSFEVTERQEVDIQLDILQIDQDLELYLLDACSEDRCLFSSRLGLGENERITRTLDPGTYYVVVDGHRGDASDYRLTIDYDCNLYCDLIPVIDESPDDNYIQFDNLNDLDIQYYTVSYFEDTTTIIDSISLADGQSLDYYCPRPGCYFFCFWYLSEEGELLSCCFKYCASFPWYDCTHYPIVIDGTYDVFDDNTFTCQFSCAGDDIADTEGSSEVTDSSFIQISGDGVDTMVHLATDIRLPFGEYTVCCYRWDPICKYYSICCRTICFPYIPEEDVCDPPHFTQDQNQSNLFVWAPESALKVNVSVSPVLAGNRLEDVSPDLALFSIWEFEVNVPGVYKLCELDADGNEVCCEYICWQPEEIADDECFEVTYGEHNRVLLECKNDRPVYNWCVTPLCDVGGEIGDEVAGKRYLYGNKTSFIPHPDCDRYEICKTYDACCGELATCCDTICIRSFDPYVYDEEETRVFDYCNLIQINDFDVSEEGRTYGLFEYIGSSEGLNSPQWEIWYESEEGNYVQDFVGDDNIVLDTRLSNYSFNPGRIYFVCYSYLDAHGCRVWCCIKISIPRDCDDHDYRYVPFSDGLGYQYQTTTQDSLVFWSVSDGTYNSNPDEIFEVRYPRFGTYRICCFVWNPLTKCYVLCCVEYCVVEDPLACGQENISTTFNADNGTWRLVPPAGATNVRWQIDIPLSLAGTEILNPAAFDPAFYGIRPGTKVVVSVSYRDGSGCRRVCCKELCSSGPDDCDGFICDQPTQDTCETFNQYTIDTPVSDYNGWEVAFNQESLFIGSRNGDNYLNITTNNTSRGNEYTLPYSIPLDSQLIISYDIWIGIHSGIQVQFLNDVGDLGFLNIYSDQNADKYIDFMLADFRSDTSNIDFPLEEWFEIKLTLDRSQQRVALYVNDQLAHRARFSVDVLLEKLYVDNAFAESSESRLDNICIFSCNPCDQDICGKIICESEEDIFCDRIEPYTVGSDIADYDNWSSGNTTASCTVDSADNNQYVKVAQDNGADCGAKFIIPVDALADSILFFQYDIWISNNSGLQTLIFDSLNTNQGFFNFQTIGDSTAINYGLFNVMSNDYDRFNFPVEEWFTFRIAMDKSRDFVIVYVNDQELMRYQGSLYATIGAVEFDAQLTPRGEARVDNFCVSVCDTCVAFDDNYDLSCELINVDRIESEDNSLFIFFSTSIEQITTWEIIDPNTNQVLLKRETDTPLFESDLFRAGLDYIVCVYYIDTEGCLKRCCLKLRIPSSCTLNTPYFISSDDSSTTYGIEGQKSDPDLTLIAWWVDGNKEQPTQDIVVSFETPGDHQVCGMYLDIVTRCRVICCTDLCIPIGSEYPACDNVVINGPENDVITLQSLDAEPVWSILGIDGIYDRDNTITIDLNDPDIIDALGGGNEITVCQVYDNGNCKTHCCETICILPGEADCGLFNVSTETDQNDYVFILNDQNADALFTEIVLPDGSRILWTEESYRSDIPGTYLFTRGYISGCGDTLRCTEERCVTPQVVCSDVMVDITDSTAVFTHNILNGASYLWDYGDGTTSDDPQSPRTHSYPSGENSYIACLTVTDFCGVACTACVDVEIEEDNRTDDLMVSTEVIDPTCFNVADGQISLEIQGGVQPYEIVWSTGAEDVIRLQSLAQGRYTVTVQDAEGTLFEMTFDLMAPPAPQIEILLSASSCENGSGTVEVNAVNDISLDLFEWQPLDISTTEGRLTELFPGDYSVFITDENGCISERTFTIETTDLFDVSLGNDQVLCDGQSTDLFIPYDPSDYIITWLKDGFLLTQDVSDITVDETGIYAVIVDDQNGCTQSDTVSITITTTTLQSIDTVFTVNQGDTITLFHPGAVSVNWSTDQGVFSCTPCAETQYIVGSSATITAVASDENGCLVESTIEVISSEGPLSGPNMITPNGDAFNETLFFTALDRYPENRLTIINKWGDIIYEIDNYQNDWNGISDGTLYPDGVYYYILQYGERRSDEFILSSDLLIIRSR